MFSIGFENSIIPGVTISCPNLTKFQYGAGSTNPCSFSVELSSFVSLKEVILKVQVVEIIISDIQFTGK